MGVIGYFKKAGKQFYPISHTKAIYDDNGKNLDEKFASLGKGISSSAITYASSSSGTTVPNSWQSTIPTVSAGSYLWTKLVITYTDGTTSTSYSIARQGSDATVNANIKKNPNDTTGDIVNTHLTIGTRTSAACGTNSLCVGSNNEASGQYSAVGGGSSNKATGYASHVGGGRYNYATAIYSHVTGGSQNEASGETSTVCGGSENIASGRSSIIIGGCCNTALNHQIKAGHFSKQGNAGTSSGTQGDAFIIGNGTSSINDPGSNAFRVAYNGNVYGLSAFNSTGADYAEMFEWVDGNPNNEDRRGLFAYIENGKMRLATSKDLDRKRLGIISVRPAVVGDNYDDDWCGKYLTDIFGEVLTQVVHHEAKYETVEVIDPETEKVKSERICIYEEYDAVEPVLNPDYDPEQEYIPRTERPEYGYWSFIGKLVVTDDSTCEANGYCYPSANGIATNCDDPIKGFYVMERIDDTHIRVLLK